MVRLIDGVIQNPVIIIGGWILAIVGLIILFRLNPEFNNEELAEYATFGAVIFVIQSIFIPIKFLPVYITLSGVPFIILVKGVNRGLIISSSAIVLNHIFIPGAFSMLGVNLVNMLLSGLVAGLVPSLFYRRLGRRVRYLTGFLAGIVYFLTISILIILEFTISTTSFPITNIFYALGILVFIFGIIEGFLTAIASSYYYRSKDRRVEETFEEQDLEEDEPEPIEFFDE